MDNNISTGTEQLIETILETYNPTDKQLKSKSPLHPNIQRMFDKRKAKNRKKRKASKKR